MTARSHTKQRRKAKAREAARRARLGLTSDEVGEDETDRRFRRSMRVALDVPSQRPPGEAEQ